MPLYFLFQVKGSIAHSDKLGKPAEATKWQLSVGRTLLHSADFPVALNGLFTVPPSENASPDFTYYSHTAAL